MRIIDVIKIYRNVLLHIGYTLNVQNVKNNKFLEGRYRGEIIRNVHSIEKGLCIENPRKFFGMEKIEKMLQQADRYMSIEGYSREIIYMVEDVLEEYINYHKDDPERAKLNNINEKYKKLCNKVRKDGERKFGGFLEISPNSEGQYEELKRIIEDRHSIRDFADEEIPMDLLKKAIELAYRSPSACNRQGVFVHIISGKKNSAINDWLSGVGGFTDKVDKYIIITGKVSEYRLDEPFQYIVSSSIFAGYLSLTLQSLGIGACLVQRPVLTCKKWKKLQKEFNIPEDEQIVVMMAAGMLKKYYRVPVSHRLNYEELVKEC